MHDTCDNHAGDVQEDDVRDTNETRLATQCPMEKSKFILLYMHIQYLASLHLEDACIDIYFYDGDAENLMRLRKKFDPGLIPRNVRLNLCFYTGEVVGSSKPIIGTGRVNHHYKETIKSMVKKYRCCSDCETHMEEVILPDNVSECDEFKLNNQRTFWLCEENMMGFESSPWKEGCAQPSSEEDADDPAPGARTAGENIPAKRSPSDLSLLGSGSTKIYIEGRGSLAELDKLCVSEERCNLTPSVSPVDLMQPSLNSVLAPDSEIAVIVTPTPSSAAQSHEQHESAPSVPATMRQK